MNVAGVNETKRNSFDANHEATPGGVIGSPVRPTPGDRNRRGNPESRSRNFLRVAVIEHKWNAICASRTFPPHMLWVFPCLREMRVATRVPGLLGRRRDSSVALLKTERVPETLFVVVALVRCGLVGRKPPR
jgi:hypothetical protein